MYQAIKRWCTKRGNNGVPSNKTMLYQAINDDTSNNNTIVYYAIKQRYIKQENNDVFCLFDLT